MTPGRKGFFEYQADNAMLFYVKLQVAFFDIPSDNQNARMKWFSNASQWNYS